MSTELSTPQGHAILLSKLFKLSHNTISDTRSAFITRHQNLLPKAYEVNNMLKGYEGSRIDQVTREMMGSKVTELHAYILHKGSPSFLSPNPAA
jgi:hypothetical protein